MILIHNTDAIKWSAEYDGPLFHAMFCDAPYHLTSIIKRFGKKDSKPAGDVPDGRYGRLQKGFMGQTWDGGDLAFRPETWSVFMRVLHPGAFGMAFASSRGWHRMAVAIEDAGFVIHPTIFLWNYASGFPKATRVKGDPRFDGHRYGAQALKPAVEPIIVFQNPYQGRPLDNIVETGAGTLNIEAGRIGNENVTINRWMDAAHPFGDGAGNEYETMKSKGRWPSNFILGDEESAGALDEQSGLTGQRVKQAYELDTPKTSNVYSGGFKNHSTPSAKDDLGGASRFFYQIANQLDESDPVYYCPKASRTEREAGLNGLLERELGHNRFDTCANCGGYLLQNPDRPSACRCEKPQRQPNARVNPHPTVKPIDLCRYLASLLLPPPEYYPRRLFVPFSGVASECIGAHLAGWDEITGVESDTENAYIEVARKRIKHWTKEPVVLDLFTGKFVP